MCVRLIGRNSMEEVCRNCEYFVQVSPSFSKYVWGDCMKEARSAESNGKKKRGTFMWADKTCSDFKPKQKPGNSS